MPRTSNLLQCPLDTDAMAAFAQQWVERLRAEQQALEAFSHSDTFWCMRQALLQAQPEQGFGDEDLAYCREETLERLGWQAFSDADIERFVQLVVDPQGSGVLGGSVTEDETCSFGNVSFVSWGLAVRMLFGQGTSWYVRPVPVAPQREPDAGT